MIISMNAASLPRMPPPRKDCASSAISPTPIENIIGVSPR